MDKKLVLLLTFDQLIPKLFSAESEGEMNTDFSIVENLLNAEIQPIQNKESLSRTLGIS